MKKGISKWDDKNIPDLNGKLALITGSNSGLGYCTAKALLKSGCQVILACRTIEKSNYTSAYLKEIFPLSKVNSFALDLSDFNEVSEKANFIKENFKSLDLLINNAGIMHPPKTLNKQGYEIQFAVNHLAHMLLTLKLLPIIENANSSRIVTVTSGAQFFGKGNLQNLRAENYYNKWESYAESKLANVMFAKELHERVNKKNIYSLAAHPGIAKTNLFASQNPKPNTIEKFALELFSPLFQTAEMGALPQLFAATSEQAKSGEHYGPKFNFRGYPKLSPTSPLAQNKEARKKLWDKSNEIISNFI